MAKILLISSHRILRQAILMFLFDHHEVQAVADFGDKAIQSLDAYDLLILDETVAGNDRRLDPELSLVVKQCTCPILSLEEGEGSGPIKKENLLRVKKPLHRESLQMALNELLLGKGNAGEQELSSKVPKGAQVAKFDGPKGKKSGEKKSRRGGKTEKREPKPIDLVDVVDEEN